MSRALWKAVAVPKLTYGNAVTVTTIKTAKMLEKSQRDAARWALGFPDWKVANEFLTSELNWSSFESREAQSKIRYFARIRSLPTTRWPKAILESMELENMKTRLLLRTER